MELIKRFEFEIGKTTISYLVKNILIIAQKKRKIVIDIYSK